MSGNLSFGGPSLIVDLSDRAPPMWTDEAEFMATDVSPTRVSFVWSPATDNLGVSAYHIMDNDQLLVTTSRTVALERSERRRGTSNGIKVRLSIFW